MGRSRAANLGRSRLLGGQSRLKAGCGQNCPPSKSQEPFEKRYTVVVW